jgi:hypothetical protein
MLYNAVLRVQKTIISRCSEENNVSLNDLQAETCILIKEECSKLFGRVIEDAVRVDVCATTLNTQYSK